MQSNMSEMIVLQQLMGGNLGGRFGGYTWLYVAMLLCLFGVITFRPGHIRNLGMFRRSCFLFAFSLVLPVLVSLVTSVVMMGGSGTTSGNPMSFSSQILSGVGMGTFLGLLFQLLNSLGPIFFGLSVIFGLSSLVPSFIPPPDFEPIGSEDLKPKQGNAV